MLQASQSSPNSSTGCGVRMVPLPHARSVSGQYLLQPQQMRSGCFGASGARDAGSGLVTLTAARMTAFSVTITQAQQRCCQKGAGGNPHFPLGDRNCSEAVRRFCCVLGKISGAGGCANAGFPGKSAEPPALGDSALGVVRTRDVFESRWGDAAELDPRRGRIRQLFPSVVITVAWCARCPVRRGELFIAGRR